MFNNLINNHTLKSTFLAKEIFEDISPMPEDIIYPRILTPGGLLVFGGVPKVGKSDFLIHWMAHAAAGLPFLGMRPSRPLKIFYLQAEVGYPYFRERIQNIAVDKKHQSLIGNNLVVTAPIKMLLNEQGTELVVEYVYKYFANEVDIIVIDSLRNFFDNGEANFGENDNSAMMSFLQNRIEVLRERLNPQAGIIITHHINKVSKKLLEEDPFQALAGAGSLRGYYSTGIIMYKSDENESYRQLIFELRNGENLAPKIIDKVDGSWCELVSFPTKSTASNKVYKKKRG